MAQTEPQVSESNPCGKLVKWIKTLGFIKFWKCIPLKKHPVYDLDLSQMDVNTFMTHPKSK